MARLRDSLLVQGQTRLVLFGVEIIRIGLEQHAEDTAVTLRNVVEHHLKRVVTLREQLVLLPQLVGRMTHAVFGRSIEQDRESDIVEHGHGNPREEIYEESHRFLSPYPAAAFRRVVVHGFHIALTIVNRPRSWHPVSGS